MGHASTVGMLCGFIQGSLWLLKKIVGYSDRLRGSRPDVPWGSSWLWDICSCSSTFLP